MTKAKKHWFYIFSVLVFLFCLPSVLLAAEPAPSLQGAGNAVNVLAGQGGYPVANTATPEIIIGRIVAFTLGFLGVVFFVLMVYGGWLWLTAAGNEEQITKAKDLIKNSIIGLVIVFASYLISYFVISQIVALTVTAPAAP